MCQKLGKKKSKNIGIIRHNGEEVSDDEQKANIFADRLEGIFSDDVNPEKQLVSSTRRKLLLCFNSSS